MAPHSSTLAWKIPWTEVPGGLQSMGLLRVGHDWATWLHFHFSLSCIGEGKGNPLQCSCLENPRDRGAWWAAIYGVTQSRTRLKRLSSSSMWLLWQQWEWCSLSMDGERTWSHPWNICLISYHWGCVSYNHLRTNSIFTVIHLQVIQGFKHKAKLILCPKSVSSKC